MIRLIIAPNAFKHSATAPDAAAAIQRGLEKSKLDCHCVCFPIADGGDGTVALMAQKMGGKTELIEVHDPLHRKIQAPIAFINEGDTCLIEMAKASGIHLLATEELNPLIASSFGTGEMIQYALDQGVKNIIITVGGSATVDGGTGILRALGIRFFDQQQQLLQTAESLVNLAYVDTSLIDTRIAGCKITVLCDVDNRLLGIQGAAAVFGPQKGASPANVKQLEASLEQLATITLQQTGKDMSTMQYGGAAGGTSAGLSCFLNAHLVNGIDYFLQLTLFEEALADCDIVITGEGSLDEQTLGGKGPFGVAKKAKEKGIPVIGIAGKLPIETPASLHAYFDAVFAIGNEPTTLPNALSNTLQNIERTATEIGNLLAINNIFYLIYPNN
jgi:glycerate kinase